MLTNPSIQRLGRSVSRALPRLAEHAWVESCNKVEAFAHFQEGVKLVSSSVRLATSAACVRRCRAADSYAGLFMLEGVGYGLAEQWAAGGGSFGKRGEQALHRLVIEEFTQGTSVPLHAGMGLWLATRTVESLETDREIGPAVAEFADRCDRVAADGFSGMMFESLGIACRLLRPEWLETIDEVLRTDPRLGRLFWHGVGRGLYFSPGNLLPWSPFPGRWPALVQAQQVCDASMHRSAVSGLAWALALVNIRHPEVVEGRWRSAGGLADQAFLDGAVAGALVWFRSHGVDRHLARFLRHEDPTRWSVDMESWRDVVNRPLAAHLARSTDAGSVDLLFQGHLPGCRKEATKS